MNAPLVLAVPSKGRLMEDTLELFTRAGLTITKNGNDRGYTGVIEAMPGVEVAFMSAAEITTHLRGGTVDLGVTGEDLLRENTPDLDSQIEIVRQLGFGTADVVVAVPACWLDVRTMRDLDEVSVAFYSSHGRRLRVATKYLNLTRRFFAGKGVRGYRIVESLGATEAAPAAGTAEAIVDITSTGSTLKANHLRILDDGLVLKSQAVLACSLAVDPSAEQREDAARLLHTIGAAVARR
jgi:ATP phosphoribosyltransferase